MTDTMGPREAKIRKGLGPKRNSTSLQVLREITIPVGTILRSAGDDEFICGAGHGEFIVILKANDPPPIGFKRVIAS